MNNRQADEVFAATYGKQKHFLGPLEAPFEGCDDQLFEWFVVNETLCGMTQKPQGFGDYLLVKKGRRETKHRPGGACLGFFRAAEVHPKQPGAYQLADAELIIQRCLSDGLWLIEVSDGYDGNALQKLKTLFLKEKVSQAHE